MIQSRSFFSRIIKTMGSSTSIPAVGRNGEVATSIFDFDVEGIDGKVTPLTNFAGKKVYYVSNVLSFHYFYFYSYCLLFFCS